MSNAAHETRIVHGAPEAVAQALSAHLQNEGFRSFTTQTSSGIRIVAEIEHTSVWTLFKRGLPPRVTIALSNQSPTQSRVEVHFDSTTQYRRVLFGSLIAILLALWTTAGVAVVLALARQAIAAYVMAAAFVGVAVAFAWCAWLVSKATNYRYLGQRLFHAVAENIGGASQLIQTTPLSKESFFLVVILLTGLCVGFVPFFQERIAQMAVLAVVVVVLWLFRAVRTPQKPGYEIRWVPGLFVWRASAFLSLFASAPWWGVLLCDLMINPSAAATQAPVVSNLLWLVPATILVSLAVILIVIAFRGRNLLTEVVSAIDYSRAHPATPADREARHLGLDWFMAVSWLLFSVLHWWALVHALGLFGITTANDAVIHRLAAFFQWLGASGQSVLLANVFLGLYWLPLLAFFGFIIVRNVRALGRRKSRNETVPNIQTEKIVQARLQAICTFAQSKAPRLRLTTDPSINAYVEPPVVPGFSHRLCLTQMTVEQLPVEQLEALLAHEVGHVKYRHSAVFALLGFLSRWTFMGEGFLAAMTKGSIAMEQEADCFAVRWLEHSGRSRDALLDLLRTLERKKVARNFGSFGADAKLAVAADGDWLPAEMRTDIARYRTTPWRERMRIIFRCVHFFYFENWTAQYAYLPLHLRLAAIRNT